MKKLLLLLVLIVPFTGVSEEITGFVRGANGYVTLKSGKFKTFGKEDKNVSILISKDMDSEFKKFRKTYIKMLKNNRGAKSMRDKFKIQFCVEGDVEKRSGRTFIKPTGKIYFKIVQYKPKKKNYVVSPFKSNFYISSI